MDGRLVALIRGINVGRAKRVAMADLRAMVEGLGYRRVRTLLNSGNLVLEGRDVTPGDVAERIEGALVAQLGISARVTVLGAAELAAAVADNSLLEVADNPARLLVAFLREPADRARLEPLLGEDWGAEALEAGARVAYLWCPDGVRTSRLAQAVDRVLGDVVTTRNWATVLKLHALAQDRGE